ncbi:flagellar biosynthetic protein FliO [Cupriavidus sp. WKF15]|uniref:flagellar biosynthetic protein FliO n=1 Tax=Cupriavidus sp. WKF15 TaxID=3032282 RepID=UPI0023E2BA6A|nr:flagellar biosynthetic protein FliO [Cupriavidus sp. WKF15]WER49973.1 flagellar biosynthetic protein FliO [Cupriavidus sp. WKF15]
MNAAARLRRAVLPFAAIGAPCLARAAEGGGAAVSSAASLAQAGLGLFGIIALILGLAWAARRAGLVRHGPQGMMKVIGSTMLGARQRLVLVEVGDTWLVLGVSAGEIRTLHSMPAGQAAPSAPSGPGGQNSGGSFAEKLLRSMQENFKS